VDTAICTKPCEDLAGQLLYGDSLHCSNFLADLGGSVVIAMCNMQLVLPKIYHASATRGVGLVQIANELTDCFLVLTPALNIHR